MESSRGIKVMKWDDKRDVTLLSTCHSNETVTRCSETVPNHKLSMTMIPAILN
jgi:hypothetical protein